MHMQVTAANLAPKIGTIPLKAGELHGSMIMIKNTYNVVSFSIATVRSSNISVRLVSPYSGVDFLGRVEVLYNGQWGTICDRYFRIADANVICGMAGFSEAICAVHNARFGRGYYSTLYI